jgi:hypothetical protein
MLGGIIAKVVSPMFAATTCSHSFFFLPNWWEYFPNQPSPPNCEIIVNNFPADIWLIGLAIIDMLLRVAGLVAIISIIIAGVSYIVSGGNPENTAKARRRIYNSLIGLAIVFVAAAVVAFIGNELGG